MQHMYILCFKANTIKKWTKVYFKISFFATFKKCYILFIYFNILAIKCKIIYQMI